MGEAVPGPWTLRSVFRPPPAANSLDAVNGVDEHAEAAVAGPNERDDEPPKRGPLLALRQQRSLVLFQRPLKDIGILGLERAQDRRRQRLPDPEDQFVLNEARRVEPPIEGENLCCRLLHVIRNTI